MTLGSPCMVALRRFGQAGHITQFRMLLRKFTGLGNPLRRETTGAIKQVNSGGSSGGREREAAVVVLGLVVRTASLAGMGAGAQRFVDDVLDGAGATAAFGAAAEAAIELLGTARKDICRGHGVADVVIAEDVAGADNH